MVPVTGWKRITDYTAHGRILDIAELCPSCWMAHPRSPQRAVTDIEEIARLEPFAECSDCGRTPEMVVAHG